MHYIVVHSAGDVHCRTSPPPLNDRRSALTARGFPRTLLAIAQAGLLRSFSDGGIQRGSGISKSRQILRARISLISWWRGDAEVRGGGLLERYIHFGITAGSRCIHSGHNPFHVAAQSGPLLIADNHEREFPTFQVLLVTHVFVSRQQKLEAGGLSSLYQFAVSKPVPSLFDGFNHHMASSAYRSGAGVPLSKSMSIDHWGGKLHR